MNARLIATLAASCFVWLGCDRAPAAGPVDSPRAAPAPVAAAPTPAPPAEEPEPAPPSVEERAEALIQSMESLAKLHEEHAEDCGGLAAAMKAFAAEHEEQLAGQSPQLHAWIDGNDAARARLRAAMGTVASGGVACRDDAAVKAVYADLGKAK